MCAAIVRPIVTRGPCILRQRGRNREQDQGESHGDYHSEFLDGSWFRRGQHSASGIRRFRAELRLATARPLAFSVVLNLDGRVEEVSLPVEPKQITDWSRQIGISESDRQSSINEMFFGAP